MGGLQDACSSSFVRFLSESFLFERGSIFPPTCLPKPTKIHDKSMPRAIPSWTSSFSRLLIDLDSQHDFQKFCYSQIILIFHPFGWQLASVFHPNFHENPSETNPKMHQLFDQFLDRFFIDLGSILKGNLEAILAKFSSQEPCKTDHNTRTKRPRPPRDSKTSKMIPKSRWGTPRGFVFLEPTWVQFHHHKSSVAQKYRGELQELQHPNILFEKQASCKFKTIQARWRAHAAMRRFGYIYK